MCPLPTVNYYSLHYTFSGYTELYRHTCVPIQGICSNGVVPGFIINGVWTLWPAPGNVNYSVINSQVSGRYSFCFNNVTQDITLTEYCYQQHTAGCPRCVDDVELLSYSYILISVASKSMHYILISIAHVIIIIPCVHN